MERNSTVIAAIVTLLTRVAATGWTGTASDLLALLPGDSRPASAAMLTKVLKSAEADLSAAGVTIAAKRQPKTGARLITLAALVTAAKTEGGAEVARERRAIEPNLGQNRNIDPTPAGGADDGKMRRSAAGDDAVPNKKSDDNDPDFLRTDATALVLSCADPSLVAPGDSPGMLLPLPAPQTYPCRRRAIFALKARVAP